MSADELRHIKKVFKRVLFKKKLVEIITHFHWFLLENVIFSFDALSAKQANLDIIKIRKQWEGTIKFTVPFEVRNMYIKWTKWVTF